MNGDPKKAKERLASDMRDLADAKRGKADIMEELAERLEEGEVTAEELMRECKERQILLEVPF